MKLKRMGTEVVGVEITGDPKNQEPECFRVELPGARLDVTRAKDGVDADYWVHLRVYTARDPDRWPGDGLEPARVTDARLDIHGKHANDSNIGDFENPDLYHMAVRVTRDGGAR
jgi:hypothetical protein